MNDKELLEFAAKATGIKAAYCPLSILRNITGMHPEQNIFSAPVWNPLTDDGDALRLAVKLRLNVDITDGLNAVWVTDGYPSVITEEFKNDAYEATRRAIVRAAAEIGKAM